MKPGDLKIPFKVLFTWATATDAEGRDLDRDFCRPLHQKTDENSFSQ